jgi:hypothetical protein
VTESNHPLTIVKDHEFIDLMTTGRPHITVPSPFTVAQDIKAVFLKCCQRISNLLAVSCNFSQSGACSLVLMQEYPGRLHFATDAWTSLNYHAFVAWTVHLEFKGEMLSFLLDIVEVAESHTGVTLARVFQDMLSRFGLTQKV